MRLFTPYKFLIIPSHKYAAVKDGYTSASCYKVGLDQEGMWLLFIAANAVFSVVDMLLPQHVRPSSNEARAQDISHKFAHAPSTVAFWQQVGREGPA